VVEFFKTVGVGASILPLAIAIVVVAAGLTALWAPSSKRQTRAIQVLKIVLRTRPAPQAGQPQVLPAAIDRGELPPVSGLKERERGGADSRGELRAGGRGQG
jgi:hypothetical protein